MYSLRYCRRPVFRKNVLKKLVQHWLQFQQITYVINVPSQSLNHPGQTAHSKWTTVHAFSFPATPVNTRNGADCSILETSRSMSQFHTVEKRKISRRNYHVKHIHAVCNSMSQKGETVWCMHCKKTRPGLFQLSLTQLQSENMHSKNYSVQLVVWVEIMVLLKEFNQLVTKFSLKNLQCA